MIANAASSKNSAFMSWKDASEESFNRMVRNMIVEDLLVPGTMVQVVAEPKVGKTFFLYQALATAVGRGEFCGKKAKDGLRVLYFDLELTMSQGESRAHAIKTGLQFTEEENQKADENLRVWFSKSAGGDTPFSFGQDKNDYDIIVIDSLYLLDVGTDENSVQAMGKLLQRIVDAFQTPTNCIILVHHCGKSGGNHRNTHFSGSGSSVVSRRVDQTIKLKHKSTVEGTIEVLTGDPRSFASEGGRIYKKHSIFSGANGKSCGVWLEDITDKKTEQKAVEEVAKDDQRFNDIELKFIKAVTDGSLADSFSGRALDTAGVCSRNDATKFLKRTELAEQDKDSNKWRVNEEAIKSRLANG